MSEQSERANALMREKLGSRPDEAAQPVTLRVLGDDESPKDSGAPWVELPGRGRIDRDFCHDLGNVLAGFSGLGLLLAALGIFGVVSYSTAQRAGELGMRMALGARQSVVLWLVLKQGVGLTMVGAAVGIAGGLALGRVLSSLMPNLPAPELSIVIGTFAFMVVVALAAFSIPAWRASKTNPMLVLRHE